MLALASSRTRKGCISFVSSLSDSDLRSCWKLRGHCAVQEKVECMVCFIVWLACVCGWLVCLLVWLCLHFFHSLSMCLFLWVPACLPPCLPPCLPACLPACLHAGRPANQGTCGARGEAYERNRSHMLFFSKRCAKVPDGPTSAKEPVEIQQLF